MFQTIHMILYVSDQSKSKYFYQSIFESEPVLDTPGMTEFLLSDSIVLGLMPEVGIKKLLGASLPDPKKGSGVPRAELYLVHPEAYLFHQRALKMGALELSPFIERSWGERVAYSMDRDGHVLAFASKTDGSSETFS